MNHLKLFESFLTSGFNHWFGNSKIVDTSGNPLVVYHGTGMKFDTFRKDRIDKNYFSGTTLGLGFYFTEMQNNAISYQQTPHGDNEPTVLEVYLSLQNPLSVNSPLEYRSVVTNEMKRQCDGKNAYQRDSITKKSNTELLKEMGYDGVVQWFKGVKMIEIVAFEPNQIKSVNNNGDFSHHSDNIYL